MRGLIATAVLLIGLAALAWADFESARRAFDRRDYTTALREWLPLARQGNPDAQYYLGLMYDVSLGVPKDAAQAVKWYRQAAEQGHARAQTSLGAKYFIEGRGKGDTTEAIRWWQRAADQDDFYAQRWLGLIYELGAGMPQDFLLAYFWYNLAASQATGAHRDSAVRDRDEIARHLTPDQLAQAQQMAREWRPKPTVGKLSTLEELLELERPPTLGGTGTGFVVSKRGHVLTVAHVVEGCREVRTGPSAGSRHETPVMARDLNNDLALLRLSSRRLG